MTRDRGLLRGAMAGAAGTTALNTAGYVDMAVRGRGVSSTPEQVVGRLAESVGTDIPGRGDVRDNRFSALGALSGIGTGVGVGMVAGWLRSLGLRLPTVLGGPLLGLVAMAASDGPIAALGVSDPRTWTSADWLRDAAPHLAYGIVTHASLVATEPPEDPLQLARRAVAGRALAVGTASGGRSLTGLAAVALSTSTTQLTGIGRRLVGTRTSAAIAVAAVGELVADKLPQAPSRLSPGALGGRVVIGGLCAALLAEREIPGASHGTTVVPAVLGGAAAAGSAYAGSAWRAWAAQRFGSDRPGALVEDGVVATLAWLGARRRR